MRGEDQADVDLSGETEVVIKILAGLAGQLTEDGDVTPVHRSQSPARITVHDFLMAKAGEDEVSAIEGRL